MKSFKVIFFAVTLFSTSLFLASCGGSKAESANANANSAPTIVDTTTTQAVVREVPTYFEATGTLASDAQTDVAPAVGGNIIAVTFDIGS